jgi:hypothetical protein
MSFGPNSTVSELVIVDTGPLIGLARIDRLELIRQLWNRVIVPPTVWREAVVEVPEAPGAPRIRAAANWIEIVESDEDLLAPIALLLDQGEAEALALAVGNRNATVLLDDLRARKLAKRLSLHVTGTVGLILLAKKRGLIENVREPLAQLSQVGLHLS